MGYASYPGLTDAPDSTATEFVRCSTSRAVLSNSLAAVVDGEKETMGDIELFPMRSDRTMTGRTLTLRGRIIDSNLFKPGSSWELWAIPEDGGSRVEIHTMRHLGGRGWLLEVAGRQSGRVVASGSPTAPVLGLHLERLSYASGRGRFAANASTISVAAGSDRTR